MKTALLFILLITTIKADTIPAWWQNKGNLSAGGDWSLITEVTYRISDKMWTAIVNRGLNEWAEYKAECYADSTIFVKESWIIYPRNMQDRFKLCDSIKVTQIWSNTGKTTAEWEYRYCYYTHKEPTFTDFMAWLERKYKKSVDKEE